MTDAVKRNRHYSNYRNLVKLMHWLILSTVLWSSLVQADEPLHFTSAETLSISGDAYEPPPYTIKYAGMHGAWQLISLPHALSSPLIPTNVQDDAINPPTIVTWYRLWVPKLSATINPRYIYIPRWKTDGRIAVYADSRLVYQSHANMAWNGWNIPLWIPLDETADAIMPHVILIRIERPRNSGGGISSIWLGQESGLSWRYHVRNLLQVQLPLMSSAAFLAVGIFSLFVWFKQQKEWIYGLFFLVSLAAYLRSMHYYLGAERLIITDAWFSWLTINSLFWLAALVHASLSYLHGRQQRWLNWLVAGMTLNVSILTLPFLSVFNNVYVIASLVYIILIMMGTAIAVTGWRNSKISKSRDGLLLASWGVVGMLFGMYDWLLLNNYISIESIYLGPYSNISAFIIFMIIFFRRYIGAIDTVKQQNANLESRLQAQNAKLQQSHQRLREIEQRQMLAQERQRIVQDMHDGLGSSLISALRVVEHGGINEVEIAQLLKDCIDDLKLAIDSMEPVEADLLLLLATLRFRIGPRLESTGIKLCWEIKSVPALNWLDPNNALHILRILQEAFTNIIKHTQATEIRVATSFENDYVIVMIIDNGQGFSVQEALKKGGKGLSNQIRRAESIAAEVKWDSSNDGTCLTLCLPIIR